MVARSPRTLLAALLLALLAPVALSTCGGGDPAPGGGAVAGVVTDRATGAPVAGAIVGDGTDNVATGADGTYRLNRPAGSHTLTVRAAGYVPTWRVVAVPSPQALSLDWTLRKGYDDNQVVPAATMEYVILAWNDLGMHCAQDDYSYFCILPPFNTLHVQVIQRGVGPVTAGLTVSFAFPGKTNSAANTNFWSYAAKYGWTAAPNVGITGTRLADNMVVDANNLGFVATGIPVTPCDDNGAWNPYGRAVITVTDNTGTVLQTAEVVAPVSTELNCSNCHGVLDPQRNILESHDRRSGTTLVADRDAGTPRLCAECHADNALGAPGRAGVKNLSLAMHGFHKDKMGVAADPRFPACYECHPGPRTLCFRGVMSAAGLSCPDCHGTMSEMSAKLAAGRKPWLEEPRCGDCHGAQHAENPGTLFRNSIFANGPDPKMNGQLYCEACHNSTHAEFGSTVAGDHSIPQTFQGDNLWIWNCFVCHTDAMTSPSIHL